MAVDAIGPLHRSKDARCLARIALSVGDARVGDQDVEIVPGRLGELGLGVEEVHDAQVGRDPASNCSNTWRDTLRRSRQRPDAFEASAEIRRRGADGGRLHQRMARRAVLRRSIRAALALRRRPAAAASAAGLRGGENSERRSKSAPAPARRLPSAPTPQPADPVRLCPRAFAHRGPSQSLHYSLARLDHFADQLYGCEQLTSRPHRLIHAPLISSG